MNVDKIVNIVSNLVYSHEEQIAIELLRNLHKGEQFHTNQYDKLQFYADIYTKLNPKVMQKIIKAYK